MEAKTGAEKPAVSNEKLKAQQIDMSKKEND